MQVKLKSQNNNKKKQSNLNSTQLNPNQPNFTQLNENHTEYQIGQNEKKKKKNFYSNSLCNVC